MITKQKILGLFITLSLFLGSCGDDFEDEKNELEKEKKEWLATQEKLDSALAASQMTLQNQKVKNILLYQLDLDLAAVNVHAEMKDGKMSKLHYKKSEFWNLGVNRSVATLALMTTTITYEVAYKDSIIASLKSNERTLELEWTDGEISKLKDTNLKSGKYQVAMLENSRIVSSETFKEDGTSEYKSEYSYNDFGQVVLLKKIENEETEKEIFEYNDNHQLIKYQSKNKDDELVENVTCEYDEAGKIKKYNYEELKDTKYEYVSTMEGDLKVLLRKYYRWTTNDENPDGLYELREERLIKENSDNKIVYDKTQEGNSIEEKSWNYEGEKTYFNYQTYEKVDEEWVIDFKSKKVYAKEDILEEYTRISYQYQKAIPIDSAVYSYEFNDDYSSVTSYTYEKIYFEDDGKSISNAFKTKDEYPSLFDASKGVTSSTYGASNENNASVKIDYSYSYDKNNGTYTVISKNEATKVKKEENIYDSKYVEYSWNDETDELKLYKTTTILEFYEEAPYGPKKRTIEFANPDDGSNVTQENSVNSSYSSSWSDVTN